MRTVRSNVTYVEKASRWEILVRILYSIPISVVLWFFGIIAGISELILFLHILILGRRHKELNKLVSAYLDYFIKVSAYLRFLTDERPRIIPKF